MKHYISRSSGLRVSTRSNRRLANNGLQLTKAARCAPFPFCSWGQSLGAAFAAEPGCSAGVRDSPQAVTGPAGPTR